MPNIRQQEKRVRQAARQRQENLRRLRETSEAGDAEATQTAHRELVRWLDRAVSSGVLHKNTVARRKSQAAKLAAGTPADAS